MADLEKKADSLVAQGLDLYQQGELERALAKWRLALQLVPEHPRAAEYLQYVDGNRDALEQRFRLASTSGDQFDSLDPADAEPGDSGPELEPQSEDQLASFRAEQTPPSPEQNDSRHTHPTAEHPAALEAFDTVADDGSDGPFSASPLEVVQGGGEGLINDFEPMEKTPVGINIPDPVKLESVEISMEDSIEADEDALLIDAYTPAVHPIGEADTEEVDDGDILGELELTGDNSAGKPAAGEDEGDEGLVWEEGDLSWESASGELEVMVFEKDETTPAVADPLAAYPTEAEPLVAETPASPPPLPADEEPSPAVVEPRDTLDDDESFNWDDGEETPDASEMFPDVGFALETESEPEDPQQELAEPEPEPVDEPPLMPAVDGSELAQVRQAMDSGDLELALDECQAVFEAQPGNADAARLLERIQQLLIKTYWAELGDMQQIPTVQVPRHEIIWQDMDHRTGFLLSRIDGLLSFQDIIDISGMNDFEACRILLKLLRDDVIGMK